MNLELMNGLVSGVGGPIVDPVLDPAPGRCCVRLPAPAK
jgi:hypothetical protein